MTRIVFMRLVLRLQTWWKPESVKFHTICSRRRPIVWCPDLRYHDGGKHWLIVSEIAIAIVSWKLVYPLPSPYLPSLIYSRLVLIKPFAERHLKVQETNPFRFLRRIPTFKLSTKQIALKCKYQISKYEVPSFRKF